MGIGTLVLVALGISLDNFAVALSVGTVNPIRRVKEYVWLATAFGAFQFLMPLLGWLAGSQIVFVLSGYESWFVCAALAFVGCCMLRSSRRTDEAQQICLSSPGALLGLALATSVDSLMVGFGLAMVRVNILEAGGLISAVTGCLSFAGALFGAQLGQALGRLSRFAGGLVLVIVGVRALVPTLAARLLL